MDQDPAELLSQQNEILEACTQPSFIQFTWPPGFRDSDSNVRKEICQSINSFWSLHARQLSRYANLLRVELQTSINRMQSNLEAWTRSKHTASTRVNSHVEELGLATSTFISAIAGVSMDTLKLGRTRSRQDETEDLESELMLAMESVSTNLDLVTAQIDLLNRATATYNFLNPAGEEPQPQTQETDQPPVPHREIKYDPKESFLANLKGRQFIDASTSVVNEEHLEVPESYLISGGSQGETSLVERYCFQVMDSLSKEDYRVMRNKLIEEGEEVQGIQGVLHCLHRTISARRSLYRLRSDFVTEHLHSKKNPIF